MAFLLPTNLPLSSLPVSTPAGATPPRLTPLLWVEAIAARAIAPGHQAPQARGHSHRLRSGGWRPGADPAVAHHWDAGCCPALLPPSAGAAAALLPHCASARGAAGAGGRVDGRTQLLMDCRRGLCADPALECGEGPPPLCLLRLHARAQRLPTSPPPRTSPCPKPGRPLLMSTMVAPQEVQIFYDDFEVRRRHSLCSSYRLPSMVMAPITS